MDVYMCLKQYNFDNATAHYIIMYLEMFGASRILSKFLHYF